MLHFIPDADEPHAVVARFFDGLELIEPGVVPLSQWWPGGRCAGVAGTGSVLGYCGIARKPA